MRFQGTALLTAFLWRRVSPAPDAGSVPDRDPDGDPHGDPLGSGGLRGHRQEGQLRPDLAQKNFKVYEDNKEQTITSFTYRGRPRSPLTIRSTTWCCSSTTLRYVRRPDAGARRRRRSSSITIPARTNTSRWSNFSGTLQITQNFTNDRRPPAGGHQRGEDVDASALPTRPSHGGGSQAAGDALSAAASSASAACCWGCAASPKACRTCPAAKWW